MNASCQYCSSAADRTDLFRTLFLFNANATFDIALGDVTAPCRVCGEKDGLRPTVLAVSVRAHEIFRLDRGDASEAISEIQNGFSEVFSIAGLPRFPIWTTSDLSIFQKRISDCVKTSAGLFPYLGRSDADLDAEIVDVWKGLQGEVQTAVLTCAAGAVPGTRLSLAEHADQAMSFDDVQEYLKIRAAKALSRLPLWLQTLKGVEVSFEEILFLLVDTCSSLSTISSSVLSTYDQLRGLMQKIDVSDEKIIFDFQFEALQASLCRAAGLKNPREKEWAQAYLIKEFARLAEPETSHKFVSLKLSRTRLAQTISREAAWDTVSSFLASVLTARKHDIAVRSKMTGWLEEVAASMGHDDLVGEILRQGGIVLRGEEKTSGEISDEIVDLAKTPREIADDIVELSWSGNFPGASISEVLDLGTRSLSWGNDPTRLEELCELLLVHAKADIEKRADVLSWYGRRMKELDDPKRALAQIGYEPADWESTLEPISRIRLWTERSNALRLAGELGKALSIAQMVRDVADRLGSPENRAVATLNAGILERECGFLDEAIRTLAKGALLYPEGQRVNALESLGVALAAAGRDAEAAEQFEHARRLVVNTSQPAQYVDLVIAEATARSNAGQNQKARGLIHEYHDVKSIPTSALPSFTLLFTKLGNAEDASDYQIANALVHRLIQVHEEFVKSNNSLRASHSIAAAAEAAALFGLNIEDELWERAGIFDIGWDQGMRPITALEIMRIAIEQNDEEKLRECLLFLTLSIARFFGGLQIRAESFAALKSLDWHFRRLIGTCVRNNVAISLMQTISEIKRNAHSRAIRLRQFLESPEDSFIAVKYARPEDCLQSINGGVGSFLVLEWIDAENRAIPIGTTFDPNGVHRHDLPLPPINIRELSEAVECRLTAWHNGRQGEPYSVPEWSKFVDWLHAVIAERLPRGEHVVILEHADCGGIPFHIALGPLWTCSYASDWSAVLAATQSSTNNHKVRQGGLIYVPRQNESGSALGAFQRSMIRQREFFKNHQIPLQEKICEEADAAAVSSVLSSVDVVKIMCHGQISKLEAEVALLVARDGRLPPGHAFAASTEAGRRHRLGWTQLSDVRRAASVAFVGACSSGRVEVEGLDERIGLFATLQFRGMQAMIAPRWKIDVELAMPILDEVQENYIGGLPLAQAVNLAADAAISRGVPVWQARAFAIEGGWV
jgi:tetratricopeptide (TPR) repeat protein